MPAWESALATELSSRHHVTTRKRLQRLGISRRVIDGLCSRGRLEHIGNGVLVSPAGAKTFEQRLGVACALTGGVIAIERYLDETIGNFLAVWNRVRAGP